MRSNSWKPALLLLAGALAANGAASLAPGLVERDYARGLFPLLAGPLASMSRQFSFPLAELFLVVLVGLLSVGAWRTYKRLRIATERVRVVSHAAQQALVAAGIAYALFLGLWGFNYRRPPFAALSGLAPRPAPRAEVEQLAADLIEETNRLRDGLPEDSSGTFRIENGKDAALRAAPEGLRAAARRYPALGTLETRPKLAKSSALLSRVGVSGIYVPFTAEPLVNGTLPDSEVPFSASHELAHSRGIAREDEANFVGYVSCRLHPAAAFRYSGALTASFYAVAALATVDPPAAERLSDGRSPAVRRDIAAIQAWVARYQGPLMRVGESVNDAYLKAQGQAEGVRSYGRMVDLLLAERRARDAVLGSAP